MDDNGGNCDNVNVQVIRVETYRKPWLKWALRSGGGGGGGGGGG